MLEFSEKIGPGVGSCGGWVVGGKEALGGPRQLEQSGEGCCVGAQAESKAFVAIAIVGMGRKCWAWIHSPGQKSRSRHHPKKPYGGTLWSMGSAGSPGWLPGLGYFSLIPQSAQELPR